MPTYEYRCDDCANTFDVVQGFHDDPLTACPTCGSPVRKVFGNVGIVFKGSGFYKTDSRSGGTSTKPAETAAPTSTDGASGNSGGSSDAGSESSGKSDKADKAAATAPSGSSGSGSGSSGSSDAKASTGSKSGSTGSSSSSS